MSVCSILSQEFTGNQPLALMNKGLVALLLEAINQTPGPPLACVRLSAGRQSMSDAVQALCFTAGANAIFYGEKLLITGNPDADVDLALLARLGLRVGQSPCPKTRTIRPGGTAGSAKVKPTLDDQERF